MNKREFLESYLFTTLGEDTAWQGESILVAAEKAWNYLNREKELKKPVELSTSEQVENFLRGRVLTKEESDRLILQIKLCTLAETS